MLRCPESNSSVTNDCAPRPVRQAGERRRQHLFKRNTLHAAGGAVPSGPHDVAIGGARRDGRACFNGHRTPGIAALAVAAFQHVPTAPDPSRQRTPVCRATRSGLTRPGRRQRVVLVRSRSARRRRDPAVRGHAGRFAALDGRTARPVRVIRAGGAGSTPARRTGVLVCPRPESLRTSSPRFGATWRWRWPPSGWSDATGAA